MVQPDAGERSVSPSTLKQLASRPAAVADRMRQQVLIAVSQLDAVDHAVYAAIAATPTPALDEPMRKLSDAANNSKIWLGLAAGLAVFGGRTGRRAALRGTAAIGVTSALVNLGLKSVYVRQRPDRTGLAVPEDRHVTMPASTSFPSGHSASGFAFASAIGRDMPVLALPLRFLAAAVAYSRVHTGVHYPGDALAGAIVGASTGQAVAGALDRSAAHRTGTP
jgi:membrane-associated phospholipid phosphatase